ncbi:MAG: rRNA maturation RNase YbeY [Clostridia bacterium]|nr:rRNA maturation RNase YbeY [Clostridia bacterium]
MKYIETEFLDIDENKEYINLAEKVIKTCFLEENLNQRLYINIIMTTPENIRKINKQYRNIDKETDVLSFPMFEKNELNDLKEIVLEEVLGDIIISIDKVKKQAIEYEHSFEREFSYMLVHGFYHLMGYDHIEENEKKQMRAKEENILEKLKISRD